MRCFAAVLWACCAAAAGAQEAEQPVVRIEVSPATVSIGEAATMRVTVLVPTWFPKPPVFPSFEVANAIVRLPPDSSYPTSERIGRETWSGIVRNYRVYPLLGASYRLGGDPMEVTFANPGASPLTVDVTVPEATLRATVPAGAEGLDPYVAGRSFTLGRDIDGSTETLEAGDAIVVHYTAELDGLPAIFLPPMLPTQEPTQEKSIDADGLSVYEDEPVIEDGRIARRTETITLVFDAGGEFTIPGVSLDWWNSETGTLETASIDALTIAVAGRVVSPVEDVPPRRPGWFTLAAAALAAALVALAWRLAPKIRQRWREALLARRQTEAYAFRRLRQRLRSGAARSSYAALMDWLQRVDPALDASAFATRHGDETLQQAVAELARSLYSGREADVDLGAMESVLVKARNHYRRASHATHRASLPPLNP